MDNNVIKTVKDTDNFYYIFKIDGYNFSIVQINDDKYEIKINNKNFSDLIKEERNGKLQREKEEYLKKKDKDKRKNNHKNDYNYSKRVEDDELYEDIELQKKLFEEFEKKKQDKIRENERINNENNNDNLYGNKNNRKKFVLDAKTVNVNRMIISNLNDIFGNNYQNGYEDNNSNLFELDMKNNNNNYNVYNNNQNYENYNKNPEYYLNQMTNNLNNAKNPHNQAVLDQFFDFTNNNNNNNINYNNSNNNYNMGIENNNINNYNMGMQNNNNYSNKNNFLQNGNNNNFDDDFNPFDD